MVSASSATSCLHPYAMHVVVSHEIPLDDIALYDLPNNGRPSIDTHRVIVVPVFRTIYLAILLNHVSLNGVVASVHINTGPSIHAYRIQCYPVLFAKITEIYSFISIIPYYAGNDLIVFRIVAQINPLRTPTFYNDVLYQALRHYQSGAGVTAAVDTDFAGRICCIRVGSAGSRNGAWASQSEVGERNLTKHSAGVDVRFRSWLTCAVGGGGMVSESEQEPWLLA